MKTKQSYPAPASGGRQAAPVRVQTAPQFVACMLFYAAVITTALQAQPHEVGGKRDVSVLSYNVYVGGLIERVIALDPADTNYPGDLVLAVTQTYGEIVASAPAKRMAAVAREIAIRKPDLVGLQELSTILRQSPGDLMSGNNAPANEVVYDYLQMILNELRALGVHYQVAAMATESDVEMPMLNATYTGLDDVRLIDREAILVRADLPPGHLRVGKASSGNYSNVVVVPGIDLEVKRGWCAVDVLIRGRALRFICTHPETETAPVLQSLQIGELLNGPANIAMPVLMVGDFNADPLHRNGTTSYNQFGVAGFSDAWNALNAGNAAGGLTYGHDAYLSNPALDFVWRLDLVLYRGACFQPTRFSILDQPLDGPPFWPSDHAGIYAELRLR